MKKAIVVGGSNGIGLSIAKNLSEKGYFINILDRVEPNNEVIFKNGFTFTKFNLLDFNEKAIEELSKDTEVEVLMLTAGFGRVANFEDIHPAEIQNLFQVNTVSSIKLIRYFYDRIKSNSPFYCGIMGSIAGLMSSPMFSVYAASKSAICRFTESVNVELEVFGTKNRILNVSPGTIKGTKFHGNDTDLAALEGLAQDITKALFDNEVLLIPQYEEVFKGVLERYNADPHEYGLHSYNYKLSSGKKLGGKGVKIGYLSGTFDLFHVGHLNLLKRAKERCDYLIVGVHPNAAHKKKETFIPFEERKTIVGSCRYVDKVVDSCAEDSDAWSLYHYDMLFVGSDYKGTERFIRYEEYFKDKGVEIIYFDYTKGTSSTQIRATITDKANQETQSKK